MDFWKSMFYSVILCATCFLIGNKQPASQAFLGGLAVIFALLDLKKSRQVHSMLILLPNATDSTNKSRANRAPNPESFLLGNWAIDRKGTWSFAPPLTNLLPAVI